MYTIASLLDTLSDERIHAIWELLDNRCSLKGIRLTPLPHISWQASEDYEIEKISVLLEELTHHEKPFLMKSTGLGVFTGERVVLYLALARSCDASNLHKKLWTALSDYGKGHNFYSSDYWVPHITLANKDVNALNLSCAIAELANMPLNFDIMVDSLAILYDIQGEIGVKSIYKFRG
jgi:2'-5' RNA ligase